MGLPRVQVIDVDVPIGDTFYLTPIFDAHLDSAMCDHESLKRMADERRSLPNHRVIWIGDFCDLVSPPDIKRFRPSVQPDGIAKRDDWINAATEYVIEKIDALDLKHDLFSPGNHEDSALKFHGYDITTVVAKHFGARRGGYSGVIDYRIQTSGSTSIPFRVVYHHGAWGGRLAKGYNGAAPFFAQIDSWHMALFGHCHAMRSDREVRRRVHGGDLETYPTYIVNCGQWVQSYTDDAGITHYPERAGHMPAPRSCPLIKVTPRRVRVGPRKHEVNRYWVDYRVET